MVIISSAEQRSRNMGPLSHAIIVKDNNKYYQSHDWIVCPLSGCCDAACYLKQWDMRVRLFLRILKVRMSMSHDEK
jgi:hypothetical protein